MGQEDIQFLLRPVGRKGIIQYDETKNPITVPTYFHSQLEDFDRSLLRGKEAGNRVIIAHYISHAIKIAKKQFQLNKLVYDLEKEVTAEHIPNIGYLSGTLDFVIGLVEGDGSLGSSF